MSVLIKGMEMPTNCAECGFKINCDECEGYECFCTALHRDIGHMPHNSSFLREDVTFVHSDCRLDDCPLVQVPDHGRLIDADAIDWGEWRDEQDRPVYLLLKAQIDDIPTIIPASGGAE